MERLVHEMERLVSELSSTKKSKNIAAFVRKRNGQVLEFDASKIADAIYKAFENTGEGSFDIAYQITAAVISKIEEKVVEIEDIQDRVEEALMNFGYRKTAKNYILYRAKRAETRNIEKALGDSLNVIEDYVSVRDWRVNENSNMSYSLQGLNSHVSSSLTAKYWLTKIYTPEIGLAHRSGEIHIHDLGSLSAYCVGWDLYQLLILGFGGVSGKSESGPARHFRSALGQIVNFFYTLQGEAAGAQAFANFDSLLAPFVRHDNLTFDEVKQAMQEFVFNLNVPTRTGFQTPFTNLTMDLVCPHYLKDQPVIIGGEMMETTYGEYKKEMGMINRAFAEVIAHGDAKGRPFTFPIPTYNITKDFDWENPDYAALWEMTAKYGTPYFSNFINSDMSEEDARSMCCRLRLDNRQVRQHSDAYKGAVKESGVRRGGLFAANPMTGSIGVVTINLPRIAYTASDKEDFFKRLRNMMELSRKSLEMKRKHVEELTERGLYPYTHHYLGEIKQRDGRFWNNHFSTIGLIGMNEAVMNFLKVPFYTDEGRQFGEEVVDFMADVLDEFTEETGNLYNLEASPAEGASYRLARADKKEFKDILASGTAEVPYYTNSVHLPVNTTDDIFELLDHQDKMQSTFTGGTVIHIFLGEKIENPESVATIVKKISNNYHLPYFSITPTFSICPIHGYIPGEHEHCPYPHTEEELKKFGVYLDTI